MIEETIARLEERLQNASLSPEQRAEVQALIAELKSELAVARDSGVQMPMAVALRDDESPLDRLNQSVTEFETTHPQLVAIVNRISTTLANLGI